MPVPGTTAHTSAGPRPPLADRLTPAQWQALDVVAAVLVALWVVFDLRLRHGFRFELPLQPLQHHLVLEAYCMNAAFMQFQQHGWDIHVVR